MTSTPPGRTWDAACSPEAVSLTRQFEAAWRAAVGSPPDPIDFLPGAPGEHAGALLALLRADMALRREARQPADVDRYRACYPAINDEALVGLVYEEYCLREEAGEAPEAAEYLARFPEIAERLREVFDIHRLVAGCPSTADYPLGSTYPVESTRGRVFPRPGETVAGFRLVEELGRGSFARVFLAEERRLADRQVVIKVTRLGTREPQTLARLQHTHIVPVHSDGADPARGLHLLCMPYFGRLTLARALADPALAGAYSGADLVAAMDRLQPADDRPRSAARMALAGRTYTRAVAWLGARLAEALQHAHERGVLHLDVKPSNILLTDDGLPMLLDFNLALEPGAGRLEGATERLGGTPAYMAPEHLEAVIGREPGRIDHRADIYSLGLVLLEALGTPPRPAAGDSRAGGLAPSRLMRARRSEPPRPDDDGRSIPPAFRAVLRKCLAPDPADRYDTAGELAADLQAVADAAPLRFTCEPVVSRMLGWVCRHRGWVAAAVPIVLAVVLAVVAWGRAQAERLRSESEVHQLFDLGRRWLAMGECATAAEQFATAAEQAGGRPGLRELESDALVMAGLARALDEFGRRADPLRFHLLGFGGDAAGLWRELEDALAPFGEPEGPARWRRGALDRLDDQSRRRLVEEVDDLCFLWVVAVASDSSRGPAMTRRAILLCDGFVAQTGPNGPWAALRDWWRRPAGEGEQAQAPAIPRDVTAEKSARACFRWGLLARLRRDRRLMLAWFERAHFLRPNDYWHQFALGFNLEGCGDVEGALRHYEAAIALRPSAPWAWFNRAHLYAFRRGAWELALRDLDRAVAAASSLPTDRARILIERGKVRQAVGDVVGARGDYEASMAVAPRGRLARAARLDRARLDAEAGALQQARAAYDDLVASDSSDLTARRARARLALRQGHAAQAEADLTQLLTVGASLAPAARADCLADRAVARLLLARADEAEAAAMAAERMDPTPARVRLRARTALAAGRMPDEHLLRPDAIGGWPVGGRALRADLVAAIERLGTSARDSTESIAVLRSRAAMLSALGDHAAALAEADRAVRRSPTADSYALRAEVRLRADDRAGALADVERGLGSDRDDARFLVLRGRLAIEAGDQAEGLRSLDLALVVGARGPVHAWRARALVAQGRHEQAVDAWSSALAADPDNPDAFLGRAGCMRYLGHWENALADLQRAAELAPDGSPVLARVALGYVACLPARPDRLPRVIEIVRRAWRGG